LSARMLQRRTHVQRNSTEYGMFIESNKLESSNTMKHNISSIRTKKLFGLFVCLFVFAHVQGSRKVGR
jgi:hypothetical protein